MPKILSRLSVCTLAALMLSCGKHRHHTPTDASVDPSSDPCSRPPLQGTDRCKGAIQVELNTCPMISMTATPLVIAPGTRVLLMASFFDAEGDAVTQEWFADPDGKLDMSDAPKIYFDCESIGRKTITLVATDEHDCANMDSVEVVCVDSTPSQDAATANGP